MTRADPSDGITIRGTRLRWEELVDPRLFDAAHRDTLRRQLGDAQPFRHLVVDGWFHPELLRLAREDFDVHPFVDRRDKDVAYENTVRSPRNPVLGPAAATYFAIVNAGWFIALLSDLSGVRELIADPTLHNAGLHESRPGGRFAIHTDFVRSACTGLRNEMVLITYLNPNWQPAWNGALELWDSERRACVDRIEPELGRTILMRNGPAHYHGHPTPLASPPDYPRRSLASYYYSVPGAESQRGSTASIYLSMPPVDRLKRVARQLTPPIVWEQLKRLLA